MTIHLHVLIGVQTAPLQSLTHPSTTQIYDEWFGKSLVVLVAACPCALVLASPIATACSLARAAQGGVIVKSAATLERLPHITDAALDKTGTLTKGRPMIGRRCRRFHDSVRLPTTRYDF